MARDIVEWLDGLGLGKYAGVFVEHEVDLEVLPELAELDLEKIGIPLGPRKKLLKAMAALRAPAMARMIQKLVSHPGNPRAARKAPRKAKGRAKTVCSNLIISRRSKSVFIRGRLQVTGHRSQVAGCVSS